MKNKIIFVGLVFVLFAGVVFTANAASKITKKTSVSSSSKSSSSKSSSSSKTTSYTLKINKSGKGYVSSDVSKQIGCGSSCKGRYEANSEVRLRAVPNGGYVFDKFTPEKECSSIYSDGFGFNDKKLIKQAFAYKPAENVVCVTTMNKNKTITAVFKKNQK